MLRRSLLLATHASALCSPAAAQTGSTTHGFFLGLHAQGVELDPKDDLNDKGGGVGLDFGYGFRNRLSLFLTMSGAAMQPDADKVGASYALGEVDLGARFTFRSEEARWRPFVETALTTLFVTFQDVEFGGELEQDVKIRGPAFSIGGGASYYMAPQWSLELGLRWSTGSFDEVEVGNVTVRVDPDDAFDVQTTRLQIGVRYHFASD